MIPVDITSLGTEVLVAVPGTYKQVEHGTTFPYDVYIIGWEPWIGYGRGTQMEGDLQLLHNGQTVFMRGPHKEDPTGTYYDNAKNCDFFPSGYARLVKANEKVSISLLVSNTHPTFTASAQANARIYTVKA